jgi:hypothetical protein
MKIYYENLTNLFNNNNYNVTLFAYLKKEKNVNV